MKRLLPFSLILILFQNCTVNKYYYYDSAYNITIYQDPNIPASVIIKVPSGQKVVGKKNGANFGIVRYGNLYGWAYLDSLHEMKKANKGAYGTPPPEGVTTSANHQPNQQIANDGTIQVRGYYRKNGTYVQPYTRRAPTKH